MDCKVEILVGCWKSLEVVGAVDVGCAVEIGTMVSQRFGYIRECWSPFEDKVLEQVSHACFSVALMPRSYQDGHVDTDRGSRSIGEQEQPSSIVESILADPFDRRDDRRRSRQGGLIADDTA